MANHAVQEAGSWVRYAHTSVSLLCDANIGKHEIKEETLADRNLEKSRGRQT